MLFFRYFIPVILAAIGSLLLTKSYQHGQQSYQKISVSESTMGTVVRNAPYVTSKPGKSSSLVYFPEVRFKTREGEEIQFLSEVTSRAEQYKAGDQVPVLYNKTDPNIAMIGSFSALWAIAIIYAAGGIMTILFGFYFFYRAGQFGKKDSPLNRE